MTKVFVRDETTDKIPMKFLVIIGLCAFLDFFCLNQVIPNVPFMIADYFPNVKTTSSVLTCSWIPLNSVIIRDI